MSKVAIQPLGDQLLLEPVEPESKTAAGIYIPATAQENTPTIAKVLALGDDKVIKDRSLKVGDLIIYSKYSGTDVEYKGQKYILVSIKDVLAKVTA